MELLFPARLCTFKQAERTTNTREIYEIQPREENRQRRRRRQRQRQRQRQTDGHVEKGSRHKPRNHRECPGLMFDHLLPILDPEHLPFHRT